MFGNLISRAVNFNSLSPWVSVQSRHTPVTTEKSHQVGVEAIHFVHQKTSTVHVTRHFTPLRLLLWTSLFTTYVRGQLTDPFPSQFELSDLNGQNGFVLNGENVEDESGYSVSYAGDVNGDGFDDLLIGARFADSFGKPNTGKVYLVFGRKNLGNLGFLELSSLNGTNGIIISGQDSEDLAGRSLSNVGDVNGDKIDDFLIGAYLANPNALENAGKTYVVFGNVNLGMRKHLNLSSLNGQDGFVINGEKAGDQSGVSVSGAGDVNGDGLSDLMIGAYHGFRVLNKRAVGKTYVMFGNATIGNNGTLELSSLYGKNGFVLVGENAVDYSGFTVSCAGDVNDDGFDDLLIGARNTKDKINAGKTYLIFGAPKLAQGGILELSQLNGTTGSVLLGENVNDTSSFSLSGAGDANGDGVDDFLIGAPGSNPLSKTLAGKTYLVFGKQDLNIGNRTELSKINDNINFTGLVFYGDQFNAQSGYSVSTAGDVNGDGMTDILIGSATASPIGLLAAGKTYVVFGSTDLGDVNTFELSLLNGTNGFVINGEQKEDYSGHSVSSAGDVNGDGIADIVIGAYQASPSGQLKAGKSYVIFGRNLKMSSSSIFYKTPPSTYSNSANILPKTSFISKEMSPISNPTQLVNTDISPSGITDIFAVQIPPSSPTPLIIGLSVAGGVIAFIAIGGLIVCYKKRSRADNSNRNPDEPKKIPEDPADNANSHYNRWPEKPPPSTTDHYDEVNLEVLNEQMDQYQDAKHAKLHEHYDDLPR